MLRNARRITPLATFVLSGGAALAMGTPAADGGKPASPSFEQFKALAGEWVAAQDGEMAKKGDRA